MDHSRWITRVAGWMAGVFQVVEQTGGPVPSGPVLVVANHPNSLLDPVIIFRVAGRPTRPLAKAPLFEQRVIGTMLRGLGGLPVYRTQDDPGLMHRNEDTFRGAIAALQAGAAVQIYPEGRSHSEPAIVPLRTGAARIALSAESGSGWSLGLRIVPIGLTYMRKTAFRSRVLAVIGEPFGIAQLRDSYEADPAAAVRTLTDEIARRLHAVTLNLTEQRDAELIDTAERLYVREKRATGWRARDPLAERLPRLRAFAQGLAWLREHDPARHARLARAVTGYRRRAALLGAREGDVPPSYQPGSTLRYAVTEASLLLLLAPAALLGTLLWYPTWLAPKYTLRALRPDAETVATFKLATGVVAVPVTMIVVLAAGWLLAGSRGAVLGAVLAPLTGFAALAWHGRWQRVREDLRLFARVLGRSDQRARLAGERAALVAEFDAVVDEAGVPADA
jgi:glycerol-3-phosphate O-acyltransferase / dihydroxyacetone phosphate acyltransferase